MANYVKISTICPKSPTSEGLSGQAAVDKMLEFWKSQLQQVLPEKPDLIVIPEVCDRYSDLTDDAITAYYKVRGNQVRDMMMETARRNSCYITYSAAREAEDGSLRNSTQLIDRNGNIVGIYNKNHLVIEEKTKHGILCGKDAPVFQCDFGTVACAICFDLNFDQLRLQYIDQRPDIILFSSMFHGGFVQQYWAYSCRAFFVGAIDNQPGSIIAPNGRMLAETTNYFNFVTTTVNLDSKLVHLDYNWEKITALKEKYGTGFKMDDTGRLGSVLISSETADVTINEMIDEVGIETVDEYMQRCLTFHNIPENIEK